MGIVERKERERQEMRDNILKAAKELFIKEGYEKTSIRNIAESIEYSPATIYLYFKDKDEIFYTLHVDGFNLLLEKMQQTEGIEDPLEKLYQIGKIYIRFGIENPEMYDLMFIMRSPISKIKEKEEGNWNTGNCAFQYFLNTIQSCIDKQYINIQDTFLASMMIWSFVHGMVSLYVRERFSVMNLSKEQIYQMLDVSLKKECEILESETYKLKKRQA
ncbi:MAG: TetR/AcrR family transcriptional regulator [Flammeovirgaceae bacterium]